MPFLNHNLYQCHKLGYQKCLTKTFFLILRDVGFQKRIYDLKKTNLKIVFIQLIYKNKIHYINV